MKLKFKVIISFEKHIISGLRDLCYLGKCYGSTKEVHKTISSREILVPLYQNRITCQILHTSENSP